MSIYKYIFSQNDRRLNNGFNYEGKIFEKTLSRRTLAGDDTRSSILSKIEKVIFQLIEETKKIKNFVNYTVDKDNKYVR